MGSDGDLQTYLHSDRSHAVRTPWLPWILRIVNLFLKLEARRRQLHHNQGKEQKQRTGGLTV